MNIKMTIQYDGTEFHGSQIQPEVRTVQEEIEKCLNTIFETNIMTIFSGRTDAGVHAKCQTINFKLDNSTIPPDKIIHPLNNILPKDILALRSEEIDSGFNSRFDAKKRIYRYFIRRNNDIFRNRFSLIHPHDIDIKKFNEWAGIFVGEKDFQSFCSARSEVKHYVCNISELKFFQQEDEVVMEIHGNRFLHNMVRIILSAFMELNRNTLNIDDIQRILDKKDRTFAPKTISPKGLFLWDVQY
ncbi:MAG: tRNA pseudouridine(38-40) synthase TruA [Candidatus Delongbacteria bacterium]|nr:tRNA pseudouridine(38-40) synthase TruA [Candidatus Delongbacteria bacterium]